MLVNASKRTSEIIFDWKLDHNFILKQFFGLIPEIC